MQPPYEVLIRNPSPVLVPFLRDFADALAEAREHRAGHLRRGGDVEVVVTLA